MSFRPYEKVISVKKTDPSVHCQKCQKEGVVNRFYTLCHACNFERLHGKTLAEFEKERGATMAQKKIEKAKTTPMIAKNPSAKLPFFSKVGKERDEKLKATKAKILKHALDTDTLVCKGCGCTHGLTNSHILSKALRPDLFDVVDNITLMCLRCHSAWENGKIEEKAALRCFVQDVSYIHSVDIPRFEAIIEKLSDYYGRTGDEKIGRIMGKLEKLL